MNKNEEPEMIGANPCQTCGGEYGEHDPRCEAAFPPSSAAGQDELKPCLETLGRLADRLGELGLTVSEGDLRNVTAKIKSLSQRAAPFVAGNELLREILPLLEIVRDYEPGEPNGACAPNRAGVLCEHIAAILSAPSVVEEQKKENAANWLRYLKSLEEKNASEATTHVRQKNGIELIAAERQRQLSVEGWTPEHDDKHVGGVMAQAAALYAIPYGVRVGGWFFERLWPWDAKWYKPRAGNRIRELEKAGALIAAEIDRLLRKASRPEAADSVPAGSKSDAVSSNPKPSLSSTAPKPEGGEGDGLRGKEA